MAEIDITNYQVVSLAGGPNSRERIIIMAPRVHMTPDEALVHAAWLVAIARPHSKLDFLDVLQLVLNS